MITRLTILAGIFAGLLTLHGYRIQKAEQRGREAALADVASAATNAGILADAAANKVRDCYAKGKKWDQGASKCAE